MCLVGFYMGVSVVLKAFAGVDICLPCLWKSLLGVHCPACGLTTASVALLKGNLAMAYQSNPLIFIVLPVGMYCIGKNIRKNYQLYRKIVF